jgi:hypothetical protein
MTTKGAPAVEQLAVALAVALEEYATIMMT